MLLTQRNLQRAEDKLVGLDIFKSEFRVTDEGSMVIDASRSKSTRLWTILYIITRSYRSRLNSRDSKPRGLLKFEYRVSSLKNRGSSLKSRVSSLKSLNLTL